MKSVNLKKNDILYLDTLGEFLEICLSCCSIKNAYIDNLSMCIFSIFLFDKHYPYVNKASM
jgi:hypothetical protein